MPQVEPALTKYPAKRGLHCAVAWYLQASPIHLLTCPCVILQSLGDCFPGYLCGNDFFLSFFLLFIYFLKNDSYLLTTEMALVGKRNRPCWVCSGESIDCVECVLERT